MAFNFGTSNNETDAEKQRLSHGFFTIPFPKNCTRQERPFGLELTGDYRYDYDRVQIRIAAVQHGLQVLVELKGMIVMPAGASPKARQIKRMSDAYDHLTHRYLNDRPITTRDQPVGYIPELWNNPQIIQQRIPRHNTKTEADALATLIASLPPDRQRMLTQGRNNSNQHEPPVNETGFRRFMKEVTNLESDDEGSSGTSGSLPRRRYRASPNGRYLAPNEFRQRKNHIKGFVKHIIETRQKGQRVNWKALTRRYRRCRAQQPSIDRPIENMMGALERLQISTVRPYCATDPAMLDREMKVLSHKINFKTFYWWTRNMGISPTFECPLDWWLEARGSLVIPTFTPDELDVHLSDAEAFALIDTM